MQQDSTHPPFLGPCEVCGKVSQNYRNWHPVEEQAA